MFQPLHLLSMAFLAIGIPLLSRSVIAGGRDRVEQCLRFLAVVIVFFDPAYWIWEWLTFGEFDPKFTLPLYLCSLFWMLLPVGVFAKEGAMKQIALANVATIGLISGLMGYVFNYHINVHPFFSFVGIRTLLYHALMIFGSTLLWTSGYYQPKPGDQWRAFLPVGVLLVPSLILNMLYGYDYCYTAGGLGTPIEILSRALPKPVFLFVFYGIFFVAVWISFYRKVPLRSKQPMKNRDLS